MTSVSDAPHAALDVFNSVISESDVSTRDPVPASVLGLDAATVDTVGRSSAGSTSGDIAFSSGGKEIEYPGLVTFAATLVQPSLTAAKTVVPIGTT